MYVWIYVAEVCAFSRLAEVHFNSTYLSLIVQSYAYSYVCVELVRVSRDGRVQNGNWLLRHLQLVTSDDRDYGESNGTRTYLTGLGADAQETSCGKWWFVLHRKWIYSFRKGHIVGRPVKNIASAPNTLSLSVQLTIYLIIIPVDRSIGLTWLNA